MIRPFSKYPEIRVNVARDPGMRPALICRHHGDWLLQLIEGLVKPFVALSILQAI